MPAKELPERFADPRDPVEILAAVCRDADVDWGLWSREAETPEFRYEVRVFGEAPLRFIVRGETPNDAVRAALSRFAEEAQLAEEAK